MLISEAEAGRFWIASDDLLDGAVRTLLALGRPDRARTAFQELAPLSGRAAGDLRLALLNAYIASAGARTP
jgi:hypothetical protein